MDMDTGTTYYYNCNSIKQTGEYHVSRYVWIDGNKVLQGFIVAKVSIPEEEKGMCDALGPFLKGGEMAAAIPGIGEAIAGIFGAVSAAVSHLIPRELLLGVVGGLVDLHQVRFLWLGRLPTQSYQINAIDEQIPGRPVKMRTSGFRILLLRIWRL